MREIVFVIVLLLFIPQSAYAHHKKEVLGDSTSSSELVFPPVTAGAGFFLPDNPFYFLDEWFQQARLITAFGADQKAKIRAQIAAERLAELRIMVNKNNEKGITTALNNVASETQEAAKNVTEAASSGKDVSILSREIHSSIKLQQELLETVEDQSEGALKLKFKIARTLLRDAKLDVEDTLPEDELENEIESSVEDELEDEIENASSSAKGVTHAISVLEKLASQAAEKNQKRREEALRHAIEVKNEALQKQQEKEYKEWKEKQEKLLEQKKKAVKEALEAAKEAQKAAERAKEAQKKVSEIREAKSVDDSKKEKSNSETKETENASSKSGSGSENSGSSSDEDGDD